jgi:putative transposase
MPDYRRADVRGGIFFFMVALADRSSNLLVDEVDRLRRAYRVVQDRRPFETIAICILPDHIQALWRLPEDDPDFSTRWNLVKSGFSRGIDDQLRSPSKILKRKKGIWQRRFWRHSRRRRPRTPHRLHSLQPYKAWGKSRVSQIGGTAVFIASSNVGFFRPTGAVI